MAKRKLRKYTKRKFGKRKYTKRKYSKRNYSKRKYSKRKYNKRNYTKRKYNKRKYIKRKYSKRKYGGSLAQEIERLLETRSELEGKDLSEDEYQKRVAEVNNAIKNLEEKQAMVLQKDKITKKNTEISLQAAKQNMSHSISAAIDRVGQEGDEYFDRMEAVESGEPGMSTLGSFTVAERGGTSTMDKIKRSFSKRRGKRRTRHSFGRSILRKLEKNDVKFLIKSSDGGALPVTEKDRCYILVGLRETAKSQFSENSPWIHDMVWRKGIHRSTNEEKFDSSINDNEDSSYSLVKHFKYLDQWRRNRLSDIWVGEERPTNNGLANVVALVDIQDQEKWQWEGENIQDITQGSEGGGVQQGGVGVPFLYNANTQVANISTKDHISILKNQLKHVPNISGTKGLIIFGHHHNFRKLLKMDDLDFKTESIVKGPRAVGGHMLKDKKKKWGIKNNGMLIFYKKSGDQFVADCINYDEKYAHEHNDKDEYSYLLASARSDIGRSDIGGSEGGGPSTPKSLSDLKKNKDNYNAAQNQEALNKLCNSEVVKELMEGREFLIFYRHGTAVHNVIGKGTKFWKAFKNMGSNTIGQDQIQNSKLFLGQMLEKGVIFNQAQKLREWIDQKEFAWKNDVLDKSGDQYITWVSSDLIRALQSEITFRYAFKDNFYGTDTHSRFVKETEIKNDNSLAIYKQAWNDCKQYSSQGVDFYKSLWSKDDDEVVGLPIILKGLSGRGEAKLYKIDLEKVKMRNYLYRSLCNISRNDSTEEDYYIKYSDLVNMGLMEDSKEGNLSYYFKNSFITAPYGYILAETQGPNPSLSSLAQRLDAPKDQGLEKHECGYDIVNQTWTLNITSLPITSPPITSHPDVKKIPITFSPGTITSTAKDMWSLRLNITGMDKTYDIKYNRLLITSATSKIKLNILMEKSDYVNVTEWLKQKSVKEKGEDLDKNMKVFTDFVNQDWRTRDYLSSRNDIVDEAILWKRTGLVKEGADTDKLEQILKRLLEGSTTKPTTDEILREYPFWGLEYAILNNLLPPIPDEPDYIKYYPLALLARFNIKVDKAHRKFDARDCPGSLGSNNEKVKNVDITSHPQITVQQFGVPVVKPYMVAVSRSIPDLSGKPGLQEVEGFPQDVEDASSKESIIQEIQGEAVLPPPPPPPATFPPATFPPAESLPDDDEVSGPNDRDQQADLPSDTESEGEGEDEDELYDLEAAKDYWNKPWANLSSIQQWYLKNIPSEEGRISGQHQWDNETNSGDLNREVFVAAGGPMETNIEQEILAFLPAIVKERGLGEYLSPSPSL